VFGESWGVLGIEKMDRVYGEPGVCGVLSSRAWSTLAGTAD
jgi:hypothetical protein